MATTQYVFQPDGKLFREDITRREIGITPQIARAMSGDVSARANAIAQHERWGQFNVQVESTGDCWWTALLPRLTIKCPWRMDGGKWTPNLNNPEDPIQALDWIPPDDMRLVFLMPVKWSPGNCIAEKVGHTYLFAFDNQGATWRLPLGNLYDECRICLGQERFAAASHMQCVAAALEQFANSQWNADLWRTQAQTKALFSFLPKDSGFDQIPPERHWTSYCSKVGNAISEKVVLL